MATHTFEELLAELRAELKKGNIVEAPIRGKGWHFDGLSYRGSVYVDPAPTIAEIIMHELLHRRFPRWGEKRVDRTAKQLLRSMNSRQAAWWSREYQRRKSVSKIPVSAD